MPYLVRLGCAAVAVIAIAALTSIGLYAVVAGGVLFGAPSPRATPAARRRDEFPGAALTLGSTPCNRGAGLRTGMGLTKGGSIEHAG